MKSILKCILLIPGLMLGQTGAQAPAPAEEGFHEHDGFFLSMNIGPAFGPIVLDASGTVFNKMEFSGPGAIIDFKIGGTIAKKVTLSFDAVSRAITGPDVKVDGSGASASDKVTAGDVLYGLGITYYLMPVNIFLSGTIGTSIFTLKDGNVNASSERGFGMMVKVGKEWWTGRNWGLGISGGFGVSTADDKQDPGNPFYKGEMSGSKVFVMFNTTYN